MTIYEHKTTLLISAGSISTVTLKVRGGLMRQLWIKSNTATTVFRAQILDEDSDNIMDYGFSTGMLNDITAVPVVNTHTISITNVSPNDTLKLKFKVQE